MVFVVFSFGGSSVGTKTSSSSGDSASLSYHHQGEQFKFEFVHISPGLSLSRPLPFVCSRRTIFFLSCQRLLSCWNDILFYFVCRYSQSRICVARFSNSLFVSVCTNVQFPEGQSYKDSKCNVQATHSSNPILRKKFSIVLGCEKRLYSTVFATKTRLLNSGMISETDL